MKTKEQVRAEIEEIMKNNPAIFKVSHCVPSFVELLDAAEKLKELPEWKDSKVVKVSLSLPREMRDWALKEGKILYASILGGGTEYDVDEKCFIELRPDFYKDGEQYDSSLREAYLRGQNVAPWEMKKIDLWVTTSAAVTPKGAGIGHGTGLADLGYGLCRQFGVISDETTIVSLVNPIQVMDGEVPVGRHDVAADYILTPKKIIKTNTPYPRPQGIYWEDLMELHETYPVMRSLKKRLDWASKCPVLNKIDNYVFKEKA
jgi:5-formyltetrahydrofolate cyclo-ligase